MTQERSFPHPATLEAVAERAKDLTLANGAHPTTLFLDGEREMISAVLRNMASTHEGRLLQLYTAGQLLAEKHSIGVLQQIFLISEAWLRTLGKGKGTAPVPNLPSIETLIISQLVIQPRATKIVVFEMKRTPKGRLTSLDSLPALGEASLTAQSPILEMVALGFLGSASNRPN